MKNNHLQAVIFGALVLSTKLAAAPELKYIVIVSRHGVRSPTWDTARLNLYSAEPWPDWGVPPGYLTSHGRELIKILGSYYRERLGREHLLAPNGCQDQNRVYIWADTDQRTIETGRAFAESILPGCGLAVHSRPEGEKDPLFSGVSSIDPQAAVKAVRARLGSDPQQLLADHRGELDALQFILSGSRDAPRKLLERPEQVAAVTQGKTVELQGPFATASTLSEDLLLEYADGMQSPRLGWGRLTREGLLQILELHRVYADLMRRTPYLARARGSNLLAHILASMEQAASGKAVPGALGTTGTAVLILSGHDTNQSNLAGMLDVSWTLPGYPRDETPPGGALILSLWFDGERKYFVRLEYLAASLDQMRNTEALTITTPPLSRELSVHDCESGPRTSTCSWDTFRKVVERSLQHVP